MKELEIGERLTITLEAAEQSGCVDCYFKDQEGCPYPCLASRRSDGKDVIFKLVKE